MLMQKYICK